MSHLSTIQISDRFTPADIESVNDTVRFTPAVFEIESVNDTDLIGSHQQSLRLNQSS